VTVVADTSPINYLIQVEEIGLLLRLFGTVLIPRKVQDELRSSGAPDAVSSWIKQAPNWVQVRDVHNAAMERLTQSLTNPALQTISKNLDAGEREAIALALLLRPHFLIIDERQGRKVAKGLDLQITGTLGVLDRADDKGMIKDLPQLVDRLVNHTTFRVGQDQVDYVLRRHYLRHR
jgi:hypothetical protein